MRQSRSRHRHRVLAAAAAAGLLSVGALASCSDGEAATDGSTASSAAADSSSSETSTNGAAGQQRFPDVVDVEASVSGDAWDFDVTMSSPYDSPERYADGWRVTGLDGTEFGVHTLGHDHASEQPFTRTQSGVKIPDDVDEVTIEGRDQANGFGGQSQTVDLAAHR